MVTVVIDAQVVAALTFAARNCPLFDLPVPLVGSFNILFRRRMIAVDSRYLSSRDETRDFRRKRSGRITRPLLPTILVRTWPMLHDKIRRGLDMPEPRLSILAFQLRGKHERQADLVHLQSISDRTSIRSEERRVGKESRSRWSAY